MARQRSQGGMNGQKSNLILSIFLIFIFILGAHLFRLAEIPTGLYLDETSIGHNAALIAQTGADEYNIKFPVYFRAFGEYKNPIYIYATALIFRMFGISELNLRITSFLFFAAALGLHILLVSKLFNRDRTILNYALISFGLLPIFFVISRISFELISQLTWVTAINFLSWQVFESNTKRNHKFLQSLLLGLALGSSIYTYSTARVLSIITFIFLWIIYYKREVVNKLLVISISFFSTLAPYIVFSNNNPGAITSRFYEISYIDDAISPLNKVLIFARNLSEYWSLNFLAVHGDSNLRHSTGYGGVLYLGVLILSLTGLIFMLNRNKLGRFNAFLFANLLVSPLPAALTSEGTPNALRSLLLGYYIVLISCYGVDFIVGLPSRRLKGILTISIASLLIIEIIGFLLHYFLVYPLTSLESMGSYNFKSALQTAINRHPEQIIFISSPPASYATLRFYQHIVENPGKIPIIISQIPKPSLGSCVIFNRNDQAKLNGLPFSFRDFEHSDYPNILQRMRNQRSVRSLIKVRCYEKFSQSPFPHREGAS